MIEALIAASAVALLSLTGAFLFGKREQRAVHRVILPAAVGVFLGVTFFELIPETLEASHTWGPAVIVAGFLAFYFLSHLLDTFHHHDDAHATCAHGSARKLLIGDSIHNLADGVVIASAFMIDPAVGVLTTIGVALHEIPQEVAEYGVLIASGCTRSKAARYNFISATTIVLGVLITYAVTTPLGGSLFILTGIAAGNLLYVASADLIPELRETHRDHFFTTFAATLLGVIAIATIITAAHRDDAFPVDTIPEFFDRA